MWKNIFHDVVDVFGLVTESLIRSLLHFSRLQQILYWLIYMFVSFITLSYVRTSTDIRSLGVEFHLWFNHFCFSPHKQTFTCSVVNIVPGTKPAFLP